MSAVVAIQSNIATLVFLGQLCIAYLYATKVARAILIAHRQFSYKKTPCKMQSVFVCILLSSNELTFRELASFTSFLKTWLGHHLFHLNSKCFKINAFMSVQKRKFQLISINFIKIRWTFIKNKQKSNQNIKSLPYLVFQKWSRDSLLVNKR